MQKIDDENISFFFLKSRHDESVTSDDDVSLTLQNTVSTKLAQSQSQLYPDSIHGLKRLHSYPSGSDTDQDLKEDNIYPTGKPPVPERNFVNKKLPPPPPPRTSSTASPTSTTSPNLPPRGADQPINNLANSNFNNNINQYAQNEQDSGSESANSQDNSQRQQNLELRHQELLKKQRQLQEQYQRLQLISKNSIPLVSEPNIGVYSTSNSTAGTENVSITVNKKYETDLL